MGFGLMASVTLTMEDVDKAAAASFEEALAAMPAEIKEQITPLHRAVMSLMWVQGWKSGILWFGEQASKQAEETLQRALASEWTGGNA